MSRRRSAIAAGLLFLMTVVASPVRAAPPSNDTAAGATVIDVVPASIPVDLTEATVDGDPQFCGGGTASVWYRYTPDSAEFLTVSLAAAPANGTMSIQVGDSFQFQDCVFAGGSRTLFAGAGTPVWLQVTTDGTATTLDLSSIPMIANDRFADAAEIASLPATVTPDLTRTTPDGDSGACSFATNGAWYRLTPSSDVTVDINADADQSAFVTVTGASVDTVLACHYSWQGLLRIALQGGQTYHLQLSAQSPSSNGTSMSIDPLPPAPANDARSAAVTIASLPFSVSADLRSAQPDDDQGQCFGSDWPVVWYRYTPSADAVLALAVSGEARAAFFFDTEQGEAVAGCTAHMEELSGKVIASAGTTYDIGLAAPPSVNGPVDLTVTSTPAPTLDVVVDGNGSIERVGGVAVIKGTAACSTEGPLWIELLLRQRVGRTTLIEGEGFVSVECRAPSVAWTVRVPGDGAPFGSGSVAVDYRAEFGDWPLSVIDRGSAVVKLKGR